MDKFEREISLIGKENFKKLQKSKILLVGIGGVGGYIGEGLIRAGILKLTIVDNDAVRESNINRQIIALENNIGQFKVDVAKQHFLDINSNAKITTKKQFISYENISSLNISKYDYVIDAIDFVPGKLALIEEAKKFNVKVISCMGTGNKLHPEKFEITDINKTSVCPLAKIMRRELKEKNINNLTVLYSKEEPLKTFSEEDGKRIPSSISTVPSIAGLLIANYVILDLIK